MRTLLLLTSMYCVCLALPLQKLQQGKTKGATETQETNWADGGGMVETSGDGTPTENKTLSDDLQEANKRPIYTGKFVIRDLDIAHRTKRSNSVCFRGVCLWPKSLDEKVYVPYVMSSDFGLYQTQVITVAMMDIESTTCIRFIKQTSEADYLSYEPLDGCWSAVGRIGGAQQVSLSDSSCALTGIATHEILHALGLHHEHVRKDRDNYVKVLWSNIKDGHSNSFEIIDTLNIDLTNYDYNSIMHYAKYTFSKNNLPTLEAVPNSNVNFGQDFAMSYLDTIKINTLYNCTPKSDSKMSARKATLMRATWPTTPPKTTTATPTTTITTRAPITTTTTTTTTRKNAAIITNKVSMKSTTPRTLAPWTDTTTSTTSKPVLVTSNACGGLLTAPQGVITSPNFPNSYPSNSYCHWNITTTSKLKITFTDFNVEGFKNRCAFDKLQIYNGKYLNSIYLNELCGETLPSPITSYQNTMQVVFTSDYSANERGFRLVYGPV